jgi:hypothetical protein
MGLSCNRRDYANRYYNDVLGSAIKTEGETVGEKNIHSFYGIRTHFYFHANENG